MSYQAADTGGYYLYKTIMEKELPGTDTSTSSSNKVSLPQPITEGTLIPESLKEALVSQLSHSPTRK